MQRKGLVTLMILVTMIIFGGAGCIVHHRGPRHRGYHRGGVRVRPAHRGHHRRARCGPRHYWDGYRCRHR